jgi:hypothetical protein
MTPIPSSTIMPSTQAAGLGNVEAAESTMSSMTNTSVDKTHNNDSDTNNVFSSIERAEAAKTVQVTGTADRNDIVNVNHSAEANSKSSLKNHASEGSDESSAFEEKPSFSRHQTTKDKDKDKKKRKALAVSGGSSSGASSFAKTQTSTSERRKQQKLQDDEDSLEEDYGEHDPTTTEGQMAMNPNMTLKAACTEAKREYNRRNAARARKRNKNMVGDLQEKVHSLTRRAEDLQRSNDVLQAQLEVLQSQNRDLLVSRKDREPKVQAPPSNDILSQLLEQLQEKSEAQQQVQNITELLNSLNGQGTSSQILSSLQDGQQVGGDMLAGMQGQGSSYHLLSALWGQSQSQNQSQTFRPQQETSNPNTGLQGQSMAQLLSTFGLQGQQQRIQQQHVSGASHDQQNLQQLLTSMPTEVLYNMLNDSSRAGNNDSFIGRR